MYERPLSCKVIFFCLAPKGNVFQNSKIRMAGKTNENTNHRHTGHILTIIQSQLMFLSHIAYGTGCLDCPTGEKKHFLTFSLLIVKKLDF